jgi:hypothetical protein
LTEPARKADDRPQALANPAFGIGRAGGLSYADWKIASA